ncbi:hypothetical protein [Allopontixanthobacter sp.]|uniref:hypothetical protein n=1 Tax=Allopontixanthobacter sp. TaxID=2906452 RepID=UPI002ABCCB91|nr:hypothetical protein [Allopontixanthobacter sp.]MDZ4308402.1 hypothetical protein [Allopontixanthobacter sp.]
MKQLIKDIRRNWEAVDAARGPGAARKDALWCIAALFGLAANILALALIVGEPTGAGL